MLMSVARDGRGQEFEFEFELGGCHFDFDFHSLIWHFSIFSNWDGLWILRSWILLVTCWADLMRRLSHIVIFSSLLPRMMLRLRSPCGKYYIVGAPVNVDDETIKLITGCESKVASSVVTIIFQDEIPDWVRVGYLSFKIKLGEKLKNKPPYWACSMSKA